MVIEFYFILSIVTAILWLFKCKTAHYYLREKFYWQGPLRFFIEGYLEFSIVSLINLQFQLEQEGSTHNDLALLLSKLMMGFVVGLPFLFALYFMFITEEELLLDKNYENNFAPLYQDLRIRNKTGVYYYVVFMIRRLIFSYTMVALYKLSWL